MKNIIKIAGVILLVLAMGLALVCCSGKNNADVTKDAVSSSDQETESTSVSTETDPESDSTEDTVTESETEPETETDTDTQPVADLPFIYVTVYDGENVAAVEEKVFKADEDGDSKWTINDALITLHNDKCKDGYAAEEAGYGLMIKKLWGVENGGSYGFYKNNQMCMSLTDELSETEPDYLYAFVYSDAAGYSDAYSFFDQYAVSGEPGTKVTLTLKYISGFDDSYNPIETPLADAVIMIAGADSGFKTGEDGTVEIELPAESTVISAAKDGLTLIPPVCVFAA